MNNEPSPIIDVQRIKFINSKEFNDSKMVE